jgi:hypothetical protein
MKRILLAAALLAVTPVSAQTPYDSVRSHLVRSRGSIRAADTQLTNTLAKLDSAMKRQRVDTVTVAVHDTVVVTVHDTVVVTIHDTIYVPAAPPDSSEPDSIPLPRHTSILPAGAENIIGPQVPLYSAASPWQWHDAMLKANAELQAGKYLGGGGDYYYDLGQVLYTLAERSQDTAHLRLAREVTRAWWAKMQRLATSNGGRDDVAPRSAALGSLVLYAMDGHWDDPWPVTGDTIRDRLAGYTLRQWLPLWARSHWSNWLGRRLANSTLHYGLRDGGYALLHVAQLAMVHPDSAVRAEMRDMALRAGRDYFARLQYPDGGWYWGDSGAGVRIMKPDSSGYYRHSQPFMVGLALDGMVQAHRATGDSVIARSILRGVEWLAAVHRQDTVLAYDTVTNRPFGPYLYKGESVRWRGHWYFVFEPGTVLPAPPQSGSDPRIVDGRVVQGSIRLRGDWDWNSVRESRQNVPEVVHAFGYAYQLTRDPKYLAWGDEQFAAAFGRNQGPLADPFYCLGDYLGKQVNQAFRTSSRYLAWRSGRR